MDERKLAEALKILNAIQSGDITAILSLIPALNSNKDLMTILKIMPKLINKAPCPTADNIDEEIYLLSK